jgi:hypothetical protein
MNPSRRPEPAKSAERAALPPELLFCAVCQVSIAVAEVEDGTARRTPRGRLFCGTCATATPEERARRRASLEAEFADDAPVPRAKPARSSMPARPTPMSTSTSTPAAVPAPGDAVLELRVGELERAAFRLQARVATLEERLEEALRRKP